MTDYKALIDESASIIEQMDGLTPGDLYLRLHSAVEALVAERDESDGRWTEILERTESGWRKTNRELVAVMAERDALRAQLDSMTGSGRARAEYIDWKVTARKPGNDTWESTGTIRNDEPMARERLRLHRDMGTQPILYKRSIWVIEGPWVEVPESEGEA